MIMSNALDIHYRLHRLRYCAKTYPSQILRDWLFWLYTDEQRRDHQCFDSHRDNTAEFCRNIKDTASRNVNHLLLKCKLNVRQKLLTYHVLVCCGWSRHNLVLKLKKHCSRVNEKFYLMIFYSLALVLYIGTMHGSFISIAFCQCVTSIKSLFWCILKLLFPMSSSLFMTGSVAFQIRYYLNPLGGIRISVWFPDIRLFTTAFG